MRNQKLAMKVFVEHKEGKEIKNLKVEVGHKVVMMGFVMPFCLLQNLDQWKRLPLIFEVACQHFLSEVILILRLL